MLTGIRWVITIAVFSLGIAALVFSKAVEETNETLDRAMNHDVAWSGTQGRHEASALRLKVLRYAALDKAGPTANELKVAFQILQNRLGIWGAGDFRHFLASNPRAQARFDELREHLDRFERELEQAPPDTGQLIQLADSIKELADRIGMQSHTAAVNEIDAVRRSLRQKQSIQTSLILLLFGLGVALIGVTLFQNRSLAAATRTARESAERFAHLAMHDPLTGLLNRAGFASFFEALKDELEADERLAVLALDLDGFKAINDTVGHSRGDALLNSVTSRLTTLISDTCVRSLVARPGGDEFLVALPAHTEAHALELAQQVRDSISVPHEIEGGSVSVDVTIGVALSPASTPREADQLSLDADLALTRAKSEGKGIVCLFSPAMREEIVYQLELEREFRAALSEEQIVPHYQPQIDLLNGAVVGVEALARWHHRERGWISPEEFIPVAEASGCIVDLGRSILRHACHRALTLPEDMPVSVNMSVVQLMRDDTAEEIVQLLSSTGLEPARLKIEVTESVVISDTERGLAALRKLKEIGVGVALDDFGTGYSCLSYLHRFPWDQLKIDRSFIRSMTENRRSLAIVEHVISLAHQMGITVVAEGIEDQHQLGLLRRYECGVGQGYLFSRPLPDEELDALLAGRTDGGRPAREKPRPGTARAPAPAPAHAYASFGSAG